MKKTWLLAATIPTPRIQHQLNVSNASTMKQTGNKTELSKLQLQYSILFSKWNAELKSSRLDYTSAPP